MWKIISTINKHLVVAIPSMMLMGFILGFFFEVDFLKNLIVPLIFLMTYPMMVTLNIRKVFEGGDIKAQALTQFINFALIPLIAYGIGRIFFANRPYMALGLLLAGLMPTSGMTVSWTGFSRGNLEAAVKMTAIGLTLGSLLAPFYVLFLMGAHVEVHVIHMMEQITLIVFIPMTAGFLTQQALIRKYGERTFHEKWAPKFPPLSVLGALGVVFVAIALKARAIAHDPLLLLYIFLPLIALYAINFLLSTLIGRTLLPRGDAIALVYGTVIRSLSISLAIAINSFGAAGSDAALVISIAYMIQTQSAAWYVKFTDRIFGCPD
ncbi:MAG: arsenic resistance protein [Dissulfurispiraceae bacterium]